MRKILLAFDGKHFSEGAFEFAKKMNEKDPVLIAGVFLPKVEYPNLWSYAGGMTSPMLVPVIEDYDADEAEKNIRRFEEKCRKNGIEYRVHKDYSDFALPELKKETRFADLAVIGSESFYENLGTAEPNEYLKGILHAAGCPVVVVPESFDFPESNILAYDGSESSVFAIKQFACLFPDLSTNKTLLVYAREEDDNKIPDESYIEELAARRFSDLTIMQLDINPKKYFAIWLSEKKNAILVSGSFGRSSFSRMFRKSFIAEVIKDHKLPVFITHC